MALALYIPSKPWSVDTVVSSGDRDALARFWLSAPEDLLSSLWSSPLGDASVALIRQLHPSFAFTADQLNFRESINDRLKQGLDKPGAVQCLMAVFLYSPPGQLRIASADRWLPQWLLPVYKGIYEDQQQEIKPQPVAHQPTVDDKVPSPDFGPFPTSLSELVSNRIQLNRMLGLANLYYIDPEDQEILNELLKLRRDFAIAIDKCPESELESLWDSDLGERYWAIVRSGVQKEELNQDDQVIKNNAVLRLSPDQGGGFQVPGATNAFLIAMLYYVPGTMKVDNPQDKIPAWLLQGYQDVFASSLTTSS